MTMLRCSILQILLCLFLSINGWSLDRVNIELRQMLKDMNKPNKPFHMIGNIYYVGASDLASYLITTPKGHFLLDCGMDETTPMIKENIVRLGFHVKDIKQILLTHGHIDHAGGAAAMKKASGALLVAGEKEQPMIEKGGKGDFHYGDQIPFPPVKADRTVKDQEIVELGGLQLKAHLTPGHTKGCITWTMQIEDQGRLLQAVFVGSTSINNYRLLNNPKYPEIAEDYARMFAVMKKLPCDVFLGAHGIFYALQDKRMRLDAGEKPNPFIDPEGYRSFLAVAEDTFRKQLKKEQVAAR